MENKPLIIIVEDEKAIRDFLSIKLTANGYRVLSAFNGNQAISLATSHCPDILLLDLGLPDIDGMEVLTTLRSWSNFPILIVSARNHEVDIVRALDSGADDYVTKPFSNSVLLARIRTLLRNSSVRKKEKPSIEQSFNSGKLCINFDKRTVKRNGELVHLTPIEYKILDHLAQNPGRVITYIAICRELWGPYVNDNRTLRVNMANIRRKIEDNPADPQYIMTEKGVGYRMLDADEIK